VKSTSQAAFNRLLSDLNRFLKPHGLRRSGQSFARETDECWQIIGLQKSRFTDLSEVRFTVNFGVTSKALMELRGQDPSKIPQHWTCPLRSRIGELLGQNDTWWTSQLGDEFRSAYANLMSALTDKALPLFDSLKDNGGILSLYATGTIMGFEIDRDETKTVLFACLGMTHEAADSARQYELRYSSSPAADRAQKFLADYRDKFGL
jgi:hypothetical protein